MIPARCCLEDSVMMLNATRGNEEEAGRKKEMMQEETERGHFEGG